MRGLVSGNIYRGHLVVVGHFGIVARADRLHTGKGMHGCEDAVVECGDLFAGVSSQPGIDCELDQVVWAEAKVFRAQIIHGAQK